MNTAAAQVIPMLRKITPKTVTEKCGVDLLTLQRPVASRVLYDLFGFIVGIKQKADEKSDKGVWTKFLGRFQAVTPDGEVFESSATHIPVMEDMLLEAFLSAQAAGKDRGERPRLEIALRVAIVTAPAGKPSMTGYEFDVQRLIPQDITVADPIAKLRQLAHEASPMPLKQIGSDAEKVAVQAKTKAKAA